MGEFGNYAGGRERKKAMLGWEAAQKRGAEDPRVRGFEDSCKP